MVMNLLALIRIQFTPRNLRDPLVAEKTVTNTEVSR